MRVIVTNLYNDQRRLYEGSDAMIEQQLMVDHPFLRVGDVDARGNLEDVLEHLESAQAYLVEIEPDELGKAETDRQAIATSQIVQDMLGFGPHVDEAFRAAQFLAGGKELPDEAFRRALWAAHEDLNVAALVAFGIEPNEQNLAALQAVKQMGLLEPASMEKSEKPTTVVAGTPDAQDVADGIARAFNDTFVFEVQLAGKHSGGTLVARDEQTHKTWLLKPGSGDAGGAAGSDQERASQSAREAAWYHVAKEWGIFDHFPRAELLFINGNSYAALELLPVSFVTMEKKRKMEPNIARTALEPFLRNGILHQWAVIDFVCGNPDRHGQNVMVNDNEEVKLIDHGSAFAGPAFDPANDKNSFVPYYLRAWAPQNFNDLTVAQKLGYMPRLPTSMENVLHDWVMRIDEGVLASILHRYGISPQPTLDRLAKLKAAVTAHPADAAVNQLWVTT